MERIHQRKIKEDNNQKRKKGNNVQNQFLKSTCAGTNKNKVSKDSSLQNKRLRWVYTIFGCTAVFSCLDKFIVD